MVLPATPSLPAAPSLIDHFAALEVLRDNLEPSLRDNQDLSESSYALAFK
jgi:hypothetical protein